MSKLYDPKNMATLTVHSESAYDGMVFNAVRFIGDDNLEKVLFKDTRLTGCDLRELGKASFIGCVMEECALPDEWESRVVATVEAGVATWRQIPDQEGTK